MDSSIGRFVAELKTKGLFNSTAIIITAKHGQSPIDIHQLVRITGDTKATPSIQSPSSLLGALVAQASEDDISLMWLTDQTKTTSAVQTLSTNLAQVGGGEVYSGKALQLWYNDPATDSRTPDIIVTPNIALSTPAVRRRFPSTAASPMTTRTSFCSFPIRTSVQV